MKKMTEAGLRKLINEISVSGALGQADELLWEAVNDYMIMKEGEQPNVPMSQIRAECLRIVEEALDEADGVGYGPGGY